MSVFASVGLSLSLLVLSQVGRINTFIGSFMTLEYMPVAVAAFAFLLIRFFGQGNMTMVGRVAMGKWFNHWRGIATAIAGIPIAFAFNAAPWIMKNIIDAFGWRHACWVLAATVGGLMGLLGLLLLRDKPEKLRAGDGRQKLFPTQIPKKILSIRFTISLPGQRSRQNRLLLGVRPGTGNQRINHHRPRVSLNRHWCRDGNNKRQDCQNVLLFQLYCDSGSIHGQLSGG